MHSFAQTCWDSLRGILSLPSDSQRISELHCPNGDKERSSPRTFLQVLEMSESQPMQDWKPTEGRAYVNILDYQTTRINGMQIDHIGSGLYIDRKKYDYEEDMKGNRHYFQVTS